MTLTQIIDTFKEIASTHAQINSFGVGGSDEFAATTVEHYPLLWVQNNDATFAYNTITYNIRVWVMDLVTDDKGNELSIQSDAITILWDIIFLLREKYDMDIVLTTTASPFSESTIDIVSGYQIDLSITIPQTFTLCDVPLKSF